MLTKIIEFSIRNKLIIGLFIIALIGYGSYQATILPIDAVPDITNNQVQVITVAPSFGATDIERLVTFPIEQANSNISGIVEIRSFSRFGLSLVTIVFDDDTLLLPSLNRYPAANRCGSGIVRISLQNDVQMAVHDLVLGLNIPNYPHMK